MLLQVGEIWSRIEARPSLPSCQELARGAFDSQACNLIGNHFLQMSAKQLLRRWEIWPKSTMASNTRLSWELGGDKNLYTLLDSAIILFVYLFRQSGRAWPMSWSLHWPSCRWRRKWAWGETTPKSCRSWWLVWPLPRNLQEREGGAVMAAKVESAFVLDVLGGRCLSGTQWPSRRDGGSFLFDNLPFSCRIFIILN